MRKFHVYIETEGALEQLYDCFMQLHAMGVEICLHSLLRGLMRGGRQEAAAETVKGMGLTDRETALYLTDIPQLASMLAAGHYPVIAYIHEGNRNTPLLHVKYVIEGFEDVDAQYFIRIYQRLTGQPWHILDTVRCRIRETTVEDVDAFYEIYHETSVTRYMEDLFADRDREIQYIRDYSEKVYAFYGFGMWTVLLKETGEVIGRAGISMREGCDDPELGFVIGVPWQRQGLAEEVCRAILWYAEEELHFGRVQALVHPENSPSARLLEKLGFVYNGEVASGGQAYSYYLYHIKPQRPFALT